jgi:hypothetical protein
VLAEDAMPIKKKAQLYEPLVDEGERIEQRTQKCGPDAMPALENDVDGELLEILSALGHGWWSEDGEWRMENSGEREGARHGCRR